MARILPWRSPPRHQLPGDLPWCSSREQNQSYLSFFVFKGCGRGKEGEAKGFFRKKQDKMTSNNEHTTWTQEKEPYEDVLADTPRYLLFCGGGDVGDTDDPPTPPPSREFKNGPRCAEGDDALSSSESYLWGSSKNDDVGFSDSSVCFWGREQRRKISFSVNKKQFNFSYGILDPRVKDGGNELPPANTRRGNPPEKDQDRERWEQL